MGDKEKTKSTHKYQFIGLRCLGNTRWLPSLTLSQHSTDKTSCMLPVAVSVLPGTCSGAESRLIAGRSSQRVTYSNVTHPSFLLIPCRSDRLPNSVGSFSGWGTSFWREISRCTKVQCIGDMLIGACVPQHMHQFMYIQCKVDLPTIFSKVRM